MARQAKPPVQERRPRRAPEEGALKGLSAPKLTELRQLLRQIVLEQGRKVVVFSQWRRMLTLAHWAVSDLFAEQGLHAGFFTGAEGQRRRTQNITEFHDDPRFRVLFASDAGGVGLNLQRAALSEVGCSRIYEEKVSGASRNRPKLTRLLDHLRGGDVVVVHRLRSGWLARPVTCSISRN